MADEEHIFDSLHVEFHRGAGGGQGHPLLFVHGAWGGSWIFRHYLEYLSRGGWNCYAMNLRGHYKSPPFQLGGVTQHDYARDVLRIARRLPARPVLIGFGTGSHLIQLALSKDALAVGAVFISASLPNAPRQEVPPEVYQLPHLLPAEPIKAAPDIPPDTLAWMNALMAQAVEPRAALLTLLRGEAQTRRDFVRVPYLVLNGELDSDISQAQGAELAAYYQGPGRLELVPRVSHEGILVGVDWREGADILHAWLTTSGFHALKSRTV